MFPDDSKQRAVKYDKSPSASCELLFYLFYFIIIIMISKQTNSDLHGDIKNKQDSQDTVEDESACRELSQDLFGGASGDNACRHVLVPEKFMTDICNIITCIRPI